MHLTIRLPLIANTLAACFALSQAGAQESQSQKLLDKYRRIDAAMMQTPRGRLAHVARPLRSQRPQRARSYKY